MALHPHTASMTFPTIDGTGGLTVFNTAQEIILPEHVGTIGLLFLVTPGTLTGTGPSITFALQGRFTAEDTFVTLPFTTAALATTVRATLRPTGNLPIRLRLRLVTANANNASVDGSIVVASTLPFQLNTY